MSEPRPLGASSLEALQELAGPAGETEELLNVPVTEIHFDPRQPRQDFAEGKAKAADRDHLKALAASLKEVGFIQPLRVRPREGRDGYVVVTGECRLRAAIEAGLAAAPCIVDPDPMPPEQRLLLQISENLLRSDLKLLDLAQALDDLANQSDLDDQDLAKRLGKSKAWLSSHRRVVRAEGLAREALEENHIRSPETLRLFQKLPEKVQRRLVHRARETGEPIRRRAVKALVDKGKGPGKGKVGDIRDPAPAKATVYVLRLEEADVRRLAGLLGAKLPESRADWIPRLLEAVAELPQSR